MADAKSTLPPLTENFLPKVDGVTRTLARLLEHLNAEGHDAIVLGPETGVVSPLAVQSEPSNAASSESSRTDILDWNDLPAPLSFSASMLVTLSLALSACRSSSTRD